MMRWTRVLYVAAGGVLGTTAARLAFHRPILLPALIAASVALLGGMLLSWALSPPRKRSSAGHAGRLSR